tara:strand:+ start:571 stop:753 length:183 start_codon:yes stop_codon:yes gene_type:complete
MTALLSLAEATVELRGANTQYNRRLVRKLIDQGLIKAIELGSRHFVPAAEITKLRGSDND